MCVYIEAAYTQLPQDYLRYSWRNRMAVDLSIFRKGSRLFDASMIHSKAANAKPSRRRRVSVAGWRTWTVPSRLRLGTFVLHPLSCEGRCGRQDAAQLAQSSKLSFFSTKENEYCDYSRMRAKIWQKCGGFYSAPFLNARRFRLRPIACSAKNY